MYYLCQRKTIVQAYPLICTQSIIIFGKVLMRSEIGFNNIALLSFGKFKMAETHINRILQNAEFVEFQQTNLLWKRSTWIDNK